MKASDVKRYHRSIMGEVQQDFVLATDFDAYVKDAEERVEKAEKGLRACQALMDYEVAMDGADGKGENEEMYWKAVKIARQALGYVNVGGKWLYPAAYEEVKGANP